VASRFAGLWDRLFDNGDKDGTNEAKDDDAVEPNEPIAHLPYVSLNTGILLADRVEALFHALGELVELIFAEKSFSHSDVPPNVEILSQVSALGTQSCIPYRTRSVALRQNG
jgi:hypothetical protein